MTQLQQTEFEILKAFDQVCTRLGLPYFLVCGSALGAVKYGGFIPWDDDIDVAMYREDYEVFCREAGKLLPEHLFLQNCRTEPRFPQIYSKLRDSNTTYIEASARELPIHHGVFMDIFPLDGYPEGRAARQRLELRKRLFGSLVNACYDVPRSGAGKLAALFWRSIGLTGHPASMAAGFEKKLRRTPVSASTVLCNHGNWQGVLDYAGKEVFGEGAWMCFEGLQVRVPERYEDYLTRKYGDYRRDLPEEEKQGHHYFAVCDCDRPYTYYLKKKEEEL